MRLPEWRWRDGLEGAAGAGLIAPLVVGLAGLSHIGHRWVDILAQFPAPAFAATLLATVLLGIGRFRGPAIQAALTALILLAALWPQWFPHTPGAEVGAPVVRLYSANLYYLNNDVARIRRSIIAADPDIVVLIELGREPATRVDELLAGYPYRVASMRLDQTRGPSRSLIASRWPLTGRPDQPDGLHDVVAVVRTPLGPLNVVGVHLTRPWPYQYQWGQISQVMALDKVVEGLRGPVVVAGDFNSVSSARIGGQMKRDLDLRPASGFPGTWPSALPTPFAMTIDQVWRSPDLTFVSRKVGRPTGSDHRPVVTGITRAAR